jgi:hypothetical protein
MKELKTTLLNLQKTGIKGVEELGLLTGLDELTKIQVAHLIIKMSSVIIEKDLIDHVFAEKHEFYAIAAMRRVAVELISDKHNNLCINSNDRILKVLEVEDFVMYLLDNLEKIKNFEFLGCLDYEIHFIDLICINYIRKLDMSADHITVMKKLIENI